MRFTCKECGDEHDITDISFAADSPFQWHMLTERERSNSILLKERCEIISSEGKSYYIRACLEIPIQNSDHVFTWGVWCSLSETSYAEMTQHWEDPAREKYGPYFGWFCTSIPYYPDSMYLKSMVYQRQVGSRPLVELEPTEHPLAVDQQLGITAVRLEDMIIKLLHKDE